MKRETVYMGWMNGFTPEEMKRCKDLCEEARAAGVKREESSCGRCCTQYTYPGYVSYKIDSSD